MALSVICMYWHWVKNAYTQTYEPYIKFGIFPGVRDVLYMKNEGKKDMVMTGHLCYLKLNLVRDDKEIRLKGSWKHGFMNFLMLNDLFWRPEDNCLGFVSCTSIRKPYNIETSNAFRQQNKSCLLDKKIHKTVCCVLIFIEIQVSDILIFKIECQT